ncbi:hypothetical protein NEF87_004408 [Candidatus Lokiarchaeum ossiferum]|uniref:Molybdopterin cofactor biosynthesis MoaD-related C-terminal domain-containing protein n=1 Tax=Candidatus Lokiarchaeum ossiferum TaxID=2951803 RepID=A0ABY6HXL7_9ARCH|nr:hypothetical protein NEF87_004408 [Candidatus Lokiarchaeum sp. B-35]
MVHEKSILSGIRRKYLLAYIQSLCENSKDDTFFFGPGWEIEVQEEQAKSTGIVNLTKTLVIFRGDSTIIDPIMYRFRMEFLSAGG